MLKKEKKVNYITFRKYLYRLIIFEKPKRQYFGDLSEIPNELKRNTPYIYIFTIIDNLSSF